MLSIRPAKTSDFEILTDIAIESEAYWGYDSNFMEKFKSVYQLTEDFISNNPTFILQKKENIIGFYGVLSGNKEFILEYFFIEPKSIGKGYGKLLWNHMINNCYKLGIKELIIISDPHAKEFYITMGAIPIGEIESRVIKWCKVPQLVYKLSG